MVFDARAHAALMRRLYLEYYPRGHTTLTLPPPDACCMRERRPGEWATTRLAVFGVRSVICEIFYSMWKISQITDLTPNYYLEIAEELLRIVHRCVVLALQ